MSRHIAIQDRSKSSLWRFAAVAAISALILGANIQPFQDRAKASATLTVTYESNNDQHQAGATNGSAPTTTTHSSGDVVTVASSDISRIGFIFAGWDTSSSGVGSRYQPNETFTITQDTTLYAIWSIPKAARLFGITDTAGRTEKIIAVSGIVSGGVRGITTDGVYVYYIPSTPANTIRQVNFDGSGVIDRTITYTSATGVARLPVDNADLTYSNGCIFYRDRSTAGVDLYCIDTTNWTSYKVTLPNDKPLMTGQFWLDDNLIDFPDGRIGAVSANSQTLNRGTAAGECPNLFYCKVLRLYTITKTTSPTIAISLQHSQDMVLADRQINWPDDDHGIATDGTYLYQSRYMGGYKVFGLNNSGPSYVVFNGAGIGTPAGFGQDPAGAASCGATSGLSGGICRINFSTTVNGVTRTVTNATYFGRDHVSGRYIMGDYSGPRFVVTEAAAPPAGPGSVARPNTPTNLAGAATTELVTLTWTAPTGGPAVVSYEVTASPGGATCSVLSPATSCEISGLTPGVSYTFSVVSKNNGGPSEPAAAPGPISLQSNSSQAPRSGNDSGAQTSAGLIAQPSARIRPADDRLESRLIIKIPQEKRIEKIRVRLYSDRGELLEEFDVPVRSSTRTMEIEIARKFGSFDARLTPMVGQTQAGGVLARGGLLKGTTVLSGRGSTTVSLLGQKLGSGIFFGPNSSELTPMSKSSLKAQAKKFANREGRVLVTGFTSSIRNEPFQKNLSEARALEVARFLRGLGVDSWIYYSGTGDLRQTGSSERRVELRFQPLNPGS